MGIAYVRFITFSWFRKSGDRHVEFWIVMPVVVAVVVVVVAAVVVVVVVVVVEWFY